MKMSKEYAQELLEKEGFLHVMEQLPHENYIITGIMLLLCGGIAYIMYSFLALRNVSLEDEEEEIHFS